MLCCVPVSLFAKWIAKPWPAGAVRDVWVKATFSAVSSSVGPPAAPEAAAPEAAGDPDAPAEPLGVALLKASCQQSGKGVASGAGL